MIYSDSGQWPSFIIIIVVVIFVDRLLDRQYLCNLFAFERRVASIQRTGKWFVEEVYTLCSDEKFLQFLLGINGVHFQDRIFVASRRIKDFR